MSNRRRKNVWLTAAVVALSAGMALAGGETNIKPQAGMSPDDARAALHALMDSGVDLAYDPYTILVKFKDGARVEPAAIAAQVGGIVYRDFPIVPGLYQMTISDMTVDQALKRLSSPQLAGLIEYAEPDYIVHATGFPNDPKFGQLWGMNQANDKDIDAPEAWDVWTGDPNFVVADIDTSIRLDNPDLAGNIWVNPGEIPNNGVDDDGNGKVDDINGWDFFSNDNNPSSTQNSWSYQHGTHTAGTIGAVGNNGVGVVGVNWQCSIMACRFLGPNGGTISDAIAALNYAVNMGVRVSNNSWGGGGYSSSMHNAINNAKTVGHVFVAAAGNSGLNIDINPEYPAAYDNTNLVAVAATNINDNKPSWSNYGPTRVDLGAPGDNILSTFNSSYTTGSGTSMATPHVAGVMALVISKTPSLTYQQAISQVLDNVRPVNSMNGKTVTGGVVNAMMAIGGSPNTPPVITLNSPLNGSSYASGTSISFNTTTMDNEDGNISNQVVWTSSLDGQLGTGNFSSSTLSTGIHYIDVDVSDSGGLTDHVLTIIEVTSGGGGGIPNAPTINGADEKPRSVATVHWIDNSNNETGFSIQRMERINGKWKHRATAGTAGANATSFTENVGGIQTKYRVKATGANGDSSYSGWNPLRPNQPKSMHGQLGGNGTSIDLNWRDLSDIETSYILVRQQRINNHWTNTTIINLPANTRVYTDNPPSGTYHYHVRAKGIIKSKWSGWTGRITVP